VLLKTEMNTKNFEVCRNLISIQEENKRVLLPSKGNFDEYDEEGEIIKEVSIGLNKPRSESKKSNKGSKKIDPCVEFARSGLTKREFDRRKKVENAGPSCQNRGRTETRQACTSKDNRSKSCKSQKSTKSVKSSKIQNSNKQIKSKKVQNGRNSKSSENSSCHNRGRSTTRQVSKLKDNRSKSCKSQKTIKSNKSCNSQKEKNNKNSCSSKNNQKRSNTKNSKKVESNANSLNKSKSNIKNFEANCIPTVVNSSSDDFEIEKNNSSQSKTHNTFLDFFKVKPSTSNKTAEKHPSTSRTNINGKFNFVQNSGSQTKKSLSSQCKTKSSTLIEIKKPTHIPIYKDQNNENQKGKLSSTFLNLFKVKSSRSVKIVHQSCSKNQKFLTADNVIPLKDSSSQTRKTNSFIKLFKVKSSNSIKMHENISEQNKICSNGQLNKTPQNSLSNSNLANTFLNYFKVQSTKSKYSIEPSKNNVQPFVNVQLANEKRDRSLSSKRKPDICVEYSSSNLPKSQFDALKKQKAQQDALSYDKIGNKVACVSRSELSVKQHQNKQKKKRENESSTYDIWNIFNRLATSSKSEINNNTTKKQNKKMIETKKSLDDKTTLTKKAKSDRSYSKLCKNKASNFIVKTTKVKNTKESQSRTSCSTINSCTMILKNKSALSTTKTEKTDNNCTTDKEKNKQSFGEKLQRLISSITIKIPNDNSTNFCENKDTKTKKTSSTNNSCRTIKRPQQSCKQNNETKNQEKNKNKSKTSVVDNVCTISKEEKRKPLNKNSQKTVSKVTVKISCEKHTSPSVKKEIKCKTSKVTTNSCRTKVSNSTTSSCRIPKISEQSCLKPNKTNNDDKQKFTSCKIKEEPICTLSKPSPVIICSSNTSFPTFIEFSPPTISLVNCVPKLEVKRDSSKLECERKPSKQSCMSEASKYYTAVQCPTNIFIKLKNCMSDLSSVKCNPNRKCNEKNKAKEKEDDESECPFVFTLGP